MNTWLELLLCLLAWFVVLSRLKSAWERRIWKTDPIAFKVWLSMLCLAVVFTTLWENFAVRLDTLTANNFSRLLAYGFGSLALYFPTITSLRTLEARQRECMTRLLSALLTATIAGLVIFYILFISHVPEWKDHNIPNNLAEAGFMFFLIGFSLTICGVLIIQNLSYYHQEKAPLMRARGVTILATIGTGVLYFLVKLLLIIGYFWKPLASGALVAVSKLLLVTLAFFWAVGYIHNRYYLRAVGLLKTLSRWLVLKDLEFLLDQLDRLCPPIAIVEVRPSFRQFMRNPEYHLYRAVIRILDGKTMLVDFLEGQDNPFKWDASQTQTANQIHHILGSGDLSGDFEEIVNRFRTASKQLHHQPLVQETSS